MQPRTESIHFSYTLKVSSRAKSARLKMTPHGGLVVVVPPGFDKKKIASLLLHHEEWIKKVTAKFDAQRQELCLSRKTDFRHPYCFPDFAESWTVIYTDTGSGEVELIERARQYTACYR